MYEIRPSPGKGLGVFATENIKAGTRIMAESPLLIVDHEHYLKQEIEAEFEKLSEENKKRYFELSSNHGQDPTAWPRRGIHEDAPEDERQRIIEQHEARVAAEPSIISIFQTCCMEMGTGAAIFCECARINHSCCPNAFFAWNKRLHKETIHAIKDIKEGEEITICYCDPLHDTVSRKWALKHYGFECDCPACGNTSKNSFAAESVDRRFRLYELSGWFLPTFTGVIKSHEDPKKTMERAMERAALLRQEGLFTVDLAKAYLDIAAVCEQLSDYKMASTAARKALETYMKCVGPDHEVVQETMVLVKRLNRGEPMN